VRPHCSDSSVIPRHARTFVALFLTAVVLCPLAAVNAWPFSSWRLFSTLRTAHQVSWQAVAVDSGGREQEYSVAALPHGYRGFGRIMDGFSTRSVGSRNAICGAWLQGAVEQLGPGAKLVKIYRLDWVLSRRRGGRARGLHRTPAWICDAGGAHGPT
jgi:hypothetical protein